MIYQAGEVLLKAGVITKFSIENLDALLKSVGKPTCTSLYKNLKKNPRGTQKESTASNLRDNIILAAKNIPNTMFSQDHENEIKNFFNSYLELVTTHRLSFDKLRNYAPTIRLELMKSLLDKCEPLRRVMAISMLEFNKLVFKKDQKSLTQGFLKDDCRPVHNTVFEIIYNSYDWSTKTFKDLGERYGFEFKLTYDQLKQLRYDIKETVFKWIIDAKYQPPLFHNKLLRMSAPVAPELDLVLALWWAARLKTGNQDLDFEAIYQNRLFGDSPIQFNLKEGSRFIADSVKLFRNTIDSWIIQESNNPNKDSRKMRSYLTARSIIMLYAQFRGLDIRGSVKGRIKSDRGDFNKEQAQVYNVILGLGRHLGIDPISFNLIEDQMFDMTKDVKDRFKQLGWKLYIYIRHHFRNNPDRASIKLLDQILIDSRTHFYWENIAEGDALVATQVLESLIKYSSNIGASDIRNEFKKHGDEYLWIAENWINNRDFIDNRDKFNERKSDIKTMPLNEFIKIHYPKAYTKFYNTALKRRRVSVCEIIELLHPSIDVTDLVNLGKNDDHIGPYTHVFTEILRKMGYPVYF